MSDTSEAGQQQSKILEHTIDARIEMLKGLDEIKEQLAKVIESLHELYKAVHKLT